MDMKISGAGVLSGGEYDDVKISGSAKIEGSVRCRSFSCAGAAKGEGDLRCLEDFRSSGSTHVTGEVSAQNAEVSGSLKCASLAAEKEVKLFGGVNVEGKLSGGDVRVSGGLKVGDIEAESFRFSASVAGPIGAGGKLQCTGLLNAETVAITLGLEKHNVNAIGGGSVKVEERPEGGMFGIFGSPAPFAFPWGKPPAGCLTVSESIEADQVDVVNTVCPMVSGRKVKIGRGCKIDLVRYSESIEVDSDAQVGKQEKV